MTDETGSNVFASAKKQDVEAGAFPISWTIEDSVPIRRGFRHQFIVWNADLAVDDEMDRSDTISLDDAENYGLWILVDARAIVGVSDISARIGLPRLLRICHSRPGSAAAY